MKLTYQKGFLGIDERIKLQSKLNSAKSIIDFHITDSGSLLKRNQIETVFTAYSDIKGLWCGKLKGKNYMIFIFENMLMKADLEQQTFQPSMIDFLADGEYEMFEFGGMLYIKGENLYCKTDGDTLTVVTGYIPCVAINCTPLAGGEVFEQINLICPQRRQLFSGTGEDHMYKLAEKDLLSVDSITVDGKAYTGEFNVNKGGGEIQFIDPPGKGLNNVEITYTKRNGDADRNRILGCSKIMLFGGNSDGRAFLWGNKEHPNYRFHSDLADGVPSVEYFPVNAFTIIGNSKINCIIQQYDKQLIFNEHEAFYSFCELREDMLGDTYSSFPVYNMNSTKGCIFETMGCVIDNKPVTLCEDGLNFWESTSVQDEKNAVVFSQPISDSIRNIVLGDKSEIFMFDHQANREFYFINGDIAYIYNYGNRSWYTFSGFRGQRYVVSGDKIYFSHGKHLKMLDNSKDLPIDNECRFETAFIDIGQQQGRFDVVGFEADIHIKAPVNLGFILEKSNGDMYEREFSFSGIENEYRRISFRPTIKRGLPFKITFFEKGKGSAELYSLSLKTRNKERSNRDGIL